MTAARDEDKSLVLRALRRSDNKLKIIGSIVIAIIIGLSFVIYFIVQTYSNQAIRSALFDQHKQLQIQYTQSVAGNIASDLESLMDKLEALSAAKPIQDGDFTGVDAHALLQQTFAKSAKISPVEGLYLLDKDNVVTNYYLSPFLKNITNGVVDNGRSSLIGYNESSSLPIMESMQNLPSPTFSNAYTGGAIDNMTIQISLVYPVYNFDSGKYLGAAEMILDARPFLAKYGNLNDPNSQYLTVVDQNGTVMSSPFKDIVGKNVFGAYATQGRDQIAIDHYRKVLSGQPSSALYSYRTGERLNTGEPIVLNGSPVYFAFIVTPTASIYAEIDSILSTQESEIYLLLSGIASATALAAYFILRWNSTLEKAVRERTASLQDANEKLVAQEKLQSEFINVAAHELRTPITPILIGLDVQKQSNQDIVTIQKAGYDMVVRNANRLKRLAEEILDVARIESGNFELNLEEVSLDKAIEDAINEVSARQDGNYNDNDKDNDKGRPRIEFEKTGLVVMADKERLIEVIANLLTNAIKFTSDDGNGTVKINVITPNANDEEHIEIQVIDNGKGIDPGILPKLFTKFATKSEQGTGLGLFICKAIVEAHGGKIIGENNKNGKGATFTFTLPLKQKPKKSKLNSGEVVTQ